MRTLLGFLPLLGCVGAMALCMRMMSGGKHGGARRDASEVAQLREEVAQLRAQLSLPSRQSAERE